MSKRRSDLYWYDGSEFDEENDYQSMPEKRFKRSIFEDPMEVYIEFLSEEDLVFVEVDPSGRRILITVDEETGIELREILPDNLN